MNKHKIITILITLTMVVGTCSTAVMADSEDEGKTCTTDSGITVTLPSEFNPLWSRCRQNSIRFGPVCRRMTPTCRNCRNTATR